MNLLRIVNKLFDNTNADSYVSQLRRRRLQLLWRLIEDLPRPVRIIDVGGTSGFWESCGKPPDDDIQVTLVNLDGQATLGPVCEVFVGDARDLREIGDNAYDVAFSNSVIEHVGSIEDQRAMAREIQRVAPRFYVQAPNYWFPVEPHFLFPGFQWFPAWLKIALMTRFALGYFPEPLSKEEARDIAKNTRLLTAGELMSMFPGGLLHRERLLGITKSLVVHSKLPA
ncbi:MAG: methyltransferase domain-containing protein [Nitrospiraceae bacterium]|nr:methyltransferase domain-containing protein [Nitrospiraceae bacterium]